MVFILVSGGARKACVVILSSPKTRALLTPNLAQSGISGSCCSGKALENLFSSAFAVAAPNAFVHTYIISKFVWLYSRNLAIFGT
jgi:hypothetical protein